MCTQRNPCPKHLVVKNSSQAWWSTTRHEVSSLRKKWRSVWIKWVNVTAQQEASKPALRLHFRRGVTVGCQTCISFYNTFVAFDLTLSTTLEEVTRRQNAFYRWHGKLWIFTRMKKFFFWGVLVGFTGGILSTEELLEVKYPVLRNWHESLEDILCSKLSDAKRMSHLQCLETSGFYGQLGKSCVRLG